MSRSSAQRKGDNEDLKTIPFHYLWKVTKTLKSGDTLHFLWRLKAEENEEPEEWQEQDAYVRWEIPDHIKDPASDKYAWIKYHLPGEYYLKTIQFPQDGHYDSDEVEYTQLVHTPKVSATGGIREKIQAPDSINGLESLLADSESVGNFEMGDESSQVGFVTGGNSAQADNPRFALDPEQWPKILLTPMDYFSIQHFYRGFLEMFGPKSRQRPLLEVHVARVLHEVSMYRKRPSLASDLNWVRSVKESIDALDVMKKETQGYTRAVLSELDRCYKSQEEPAWVKGIYHDAIQNVKATVTHSDPGEKPVRGVVASKNPVKRQVKKDARKQRIEAVVSKLGDSFKNLSTEDKKNLLGTDFC